LALAAEIGQELIKTNNELQSKVEIESSRNTNSNNRISQLEQDHDELITKYKQLTEEQHQKEEFTTRQKETIKKLQLDLSLVSNQISVQNEKILALENDKHKIAKEKTDLLKDTKGFQSTNNENSVLLSNLQQKICTLEKDIYTLELNKCTNAEKLTLLQEKIDCQNDEIKEQSDMLEEYKELSYKHDETLLLLEQQTLELEWSYQSNIKLTNQIKLLEPSSTTHTGSKTILSEIEDRRQELLKAHQLLEQKHVGLEVSHEKSLFRQQKMKHHIQRLSQLSVSDYSDEKIKDLQQALSQSEAEKAELEKSLDKYQRGHICYSFEDEEMGEDRDQVRLLQFRIEQIMEECEGLKQGNKTLRLVKNGETDKLYKSSQLLFEREKELDMIKRSMAALRFEYDELKMQVGTGKIVQSNETETVIEKDRQRELLIKKEKEIIVLKTTLDTVCSELEELKSSIGSVVVTQPVIGLVGALVESVQTEKIVPGVCLTPSKEKFRDKITPSLKSRLKPKTVTLSPEKYVVPLVVKDENVDPNLVKELSPEKVNLTKTKTLGKAELNAKTSRMSISSTGSIKSTVKVDRSGAKQDECKQQ
jgi:chromosome segregation ATPase